MALSFIILSFLSRAGTSEIRQSKFASLNDSAQVRLAFPSSYLKPEASEYKHTVPREGSMLGGPKIKRTRNPPSIRYKGSDSPVFECNSPEIGIDHQCHQSLDTLCTIIMAL